MKRIGYSVLLSIRPVFLLGLLVFIPYTLVTVGILSHGTVDQLRQDFALAIALLTVMVTATFFQPEDIQALEVQISLPRPFHRNLSEIILICWLILWMIPQLILLVIGMPFHLIDWRAWLIAGAGYATIILVFGGMTLLSVVAGRDSRMGLMVGLVLCAWIMRYPYIIPVQNFLPAARLFEIGGENLPLWVAFRVGYIFAGGLCFRRAIIWMGDTDRLLTGEGWFKKFLSRTHKENPRSIARTALGAWSNPLAFPASRSVGLIVYEALISIIKGPIAIVILSLGTFGFLADFPSFQQVGFYDTIASVNEPNLLRWFLAFMLPFVVVVTAASDRRTRVDQSILAVISPRQYLTGRLLGICGAVALTTLIACLPGFFLTVLAAITGTPIYLAAYLGVVILSALPLFVYLSAWGTMIGMLVPTNHPLVLGGLFSIASVVLFLGTMENRLGNILFPGGQMAARSIAFWLSQAGARNELFNEGDPIIVPLYILLLPLVSAGVQIVLLWLLSGKIYERRITAI